jgi:hypothetical protein
MGNLKRFALKVHWILSSQLGVDLSRFFNSLRGLPFYVVEWFKFRRHFVGYMTVLPCLHDRFEEGGSTKSEYFWQDLSVAQWIFRENPLKHVDVGSRVDGFVGHVASFREIEVFDVRPLSSRIPNVIFKQADFTKFESIKKYSSQDGYCDSLSCLHAIEHFGLGRYGDPIDPAGYEKGITNLALLLKPKGVLYLSTPIGRQRVEFNANWVFDPQTIINCALQNGLTLKKLLIFNSNKMDLQLINLSESALIELARQPYNLGIFIFIKSLEK